MSPHMASPTYDAAYQYPLLPAGDGETAAEGVTDGIRETDDEAVEVEVPEGRAPGELLLDLLGEGVGTGDIDADLEADGTTAGDREGDTFVPSEGHVRART